MAHPYAPDPDELQQLLRIGAIKLERTAGVPTWEALPGSRHQIIVDQIRETIVTIREAGTSVLLIEQNAMMALAVSDHGYILSHGEVTKHGPSSELLDDPDIQSFYLGLDDAADEPTAAGDGVSA